MRAPIDRPNLLWRGFVLGGVGTMAALSFSDEAWAWWEERVSDKLPRSVIRAELAGTVAVHVVEALAVRRMGRRAGLAHRGAHTRTTLVYGLPAYRTAKKAAAATAALPATA